MKITQADMRVLLGAIRAELESQRYRQLSREEYEPRLPADVERGIRDQDAERAEQLRAVREKIKVLVR